ncbi:energy transducer TonB [Sulfuricaulis sp.]|jgi:protein TonB|uniref:energy transducer TonB n=1 Tax=Sulfuricaulis sp. TaxID=2003553 RepID=UPI00355A676A
MRDSTTRYRRIMFWMTLSVLVHGIAVSWLPSPSPTEPLVDKHTLWVSAWRNAASVAPVAESAGRYSPQHSQLFPANGDAPSANTRSQQIMPTHDEYPSTEETEAMPENGIANHMFGLIRRSIQEHFVYPPFALRQGWEGEVLVALQISAEGEIRDIRVVRSSGYRILDEDALLILNKIGSIPDARIWLSGRTYRARIPVIYRLTS